MSELILLATELIQMANSFQSQGNLSQESEHLRRYLELRPKDGDAWERLLRLDEKQKLTETGLTACYLTDQFPYNEYFYLVAAKMWLAEREFEVAKDCVEAAIRRHPKSGELWAFWAEILYEKEDPNNESNSLILIRQPWLAMAFALRKAVRFNPLLPQAWRKLGTCYRKLGFLRRAIWCYRKAGELAPKDARILEDLGVTLNWQGIESNQIFEKVMELDPYSLVARQYLGYVR